MMIDKLKKIGIDVRSGASGETKTTCPKCSSSRKKSKYPCLNVNVDTGAFNCWHCGWGGSARQGEFSPARVEKVWRKPSQVSVGIDDTWLDWLRGRGISLNTAVSCRVANETVYMPQVGKEVDAIVFPYFRQGEIINAKYRDKDKNFRLSAGAERIIYGMETIGNPGSRPGIGSGYLVWVEGEMDRLSLFEAGIKSCVSVPDGAPAVSAKNYDSKFDFLESAQEAISGVSRHIIAVDSDEPGKKLQEELARRLGVEKCWIVSWPDGIKDANDMLVRHGAEALAECIKDARVCPVDGVFHVDDFSEKIWHLYENGPTKGVRAGWNCIDEIYTVRPGEWTVLTGIPGSGKSEWLDALMVNLAKYHGWKFAVCSPENQPVEEHFQKLAEKIVGKPMAKGPTQRMTEEELGRAMITIGDHFTFVCPAEPTVDSLLEAFRAEILRRGVKGVVIDPWNEIEHRRPSGQSETDYVSETLGKLRRFARNNRVHLWIVAHPTKLKKNDDGSYPVPTPYDISGSAHWRNKADNALAVWRNVTIQTQEVKVFVHKIRFKVVGKLGVGVLNWDRVTGQYWDPNCPRNTNELEDF